MKRRGHAPVLADAHKKDRDPLATPQSPLTQLSDEQLAEESPHSSAAPVPQPVPCPTRARKITRRSGQQKRSPLRVLQKSKTKNSQLSQHQQSQQTQQKPPQRVPQSAISVDS